MPAPSRVLGIVFLAIILVAGSAAAGQPVRAVTTSSGPPPPKVVLVVGPAGAPTARYRAIADAAARVALRYTPNVFRVYSPNATWPAVRTALQGASIVVYIGHGNGFPSRYSSVPRPATQNGLGLNPSAGGDDTDHQYFGEAYLRRDVRLAPGAVVLLHHLCYASGNTEPGLPEGTLDDARARVDNYAAGFLAIGAGAVIADAFADPSDYLAAILGGNQRIDRIWANASTDHGRRIGFASTRTPGTALALDPTRASSGFYRSIVLRPGLTARDVRAGAQPSVSAPSYGVLGLPPGPTLAGRGLSFATPHLIGRTVGAARARLVLPVGGSGATRLAGEISIGYRWDPLDVADPAASPGGAAVEVVPEQFGSVVAPAAARRVSGGLGLTVTLPARPGLYRLVATLHDRDGLAYDAATQALVPTLLVRVRPGLSALYSLPRTITVRPGESFGLAGKVVNAGLVAWGEDPTAAPSPLDPTAPHPGDVPSTAGADVPVPLAARLVARWIDPAGTADASGGDGERTLAVEPGAAIDVTMGLIAPAEPGAYLVLVDVVSPEVGSLAAAGVAPGIVTVLVEGEPVAEPAPEPAGGGNWCVPGASPGEPTRC